MYQTIEAQPANMKTTCANPYFLFSGLTLNLSGLTLNLSFSGLTLSRISK